MKSQINEIAAAGLRELGALTAKFSNGDGIHAYGRRAGSTASSSPSRTCSCPRVYQPCVCVIVQGTKQVLLEEEIYRYAPPQFLAVSVDLPLLGQVTEASAEKPYLCLAIDIDARQIADLIAQSGDAGVDARRDVARVVRRRAGCAPCRIPRCASRDCSTRRAIFPCSRRWRCGSFTIGC